MTPEIELHALAGSPGAAETLVVGPSLGTSSATLWRAVAEALAADLRVLAWDPPGHGDTPPASGPFTMADLAEAVATAIEPLGTPVHYAGDSLGGAVGLQLALDRPDLLRSATLCCTGARIGTAESWAERARDARSGGTASLVDASVGRWFPTGFADRRADVVASLAQALRDVDDESYALACQALAVFDVRDRLGEVRVPVMAVAGAADAMTPVAGLAEIAVGVADGLLAVLPDTGHLAPAEQPDRVAELIARQALPGGSEPSLRAAGESTRRNVLGDDHVDRAGSGSAMTRDFQSLITRYAWGAIWTRPGLARRDRSLITLTALVAGGHHEELALHLRAARRNGLTDPEIVEVLLQTAVYCGVPAANTAFRIAERVLDDPAADGPD